MASRIGRLGNKFNIPAERAEPLRKDIRIDDRTIFIDEVFDRFGGRVVTTNPPPGVTPPPPVAAPPAAPPPVSVAVDLRPLMASMPIANDGQVITAEYHNSLRAAILAIAERLGVGAVSPTNVLTFAPMFLKRAVDPGEWLLNDGLASKPVLATGAKVSAGGWFAVQLPQGSRIEGMIVTGRRVGTMEQFNVSLVRQKIADTLQTGVPIISIALKDAPDPFEQTGVVDFSGATVGTGAGGTAAAVSAAVLESDFRQVDNDNYKYIIRATLVNADPPPAVAQIHAIQVVCRER